MNVSLDSSCYQDQDVCWNVMLSCEQSRHRDVSILCPSKSQLDFGMCILSTFLLQDDRLARGDHVRVDRQPRVYRAHDGGDHVCEMGRRRDL